MGGRPRLPVSRLKRHFTRRGGEGKSVGEYLGYGQLPGYLAKWAQDVATSQLGLLAISETAAMTPRRVGVRQT